MDQRNQNLITSVSTFLIQMKSSLPTNLSKKHFMLVHGSCFGAWSWYKITQQLLRSIPNSYWDLRSISNYFKLVRDFIEAIDGKVILVSHSLGELAILKP
ncbi:hypothetical protein DVH24_042223 [Malus domestica]|uniref:AB hydrolase-1 domain-containing protein n=1 Tax=Malus domestica TaxID=3750 RepID=A0A498J2E0_MALDO|nr:hypothetical protein DVH24_042223 [Malus domestica]